MVLEVATSSLFSSPELASERFNADSGTNGRQEGVAGGYIFNGRVYGASWNNLLVDLSLMQPSDDRLCFI